MSNNQLDKIRLYEELQTNPLLAIKQYVPETIRKPYQLAVDITKNPTLAMKNLGISKQAIKKLEAV